MKKIYIVKFMNAGVKFNFNIQPGFYGLMVAGQLAAVSSGWCCGDTAAYIYTRCRGGRWHGRWVDYRQWGTLPRFADYIIRSESEEHEVDEWEE